jgi:hypothetical protein
MTISFGNWKKQLSSDKILYEQAKEMAKHGHQQQTGYKKGGKPLYAVEYYGKLYRESLAGYRRAQHRNKLKKVI